MAERNEAVRQRVVEMLDKYPTLKSKQLHDMAQRMDPSIAALSLRSFHARYVLPILRERARAEGRIRPRASKKKTSAKAALREPGSTTSRSRARAHVSNPSPGAEYARVREIVLQYIRDIVSAESRSDLVTLGAGIDDIVSRILGSPTAKP